MAYYLSKRNRAVVESWKDKLLNSKEDVRIDTEDPKAAEYIFRNAANTEEYSWIKDKYTFRLREKYLLCKLRNSILISEDRGVTGINTEANISLEVLKGTMIDIFNNLFNSRPMAIAYSRNELSLDDIERLKSWCKKNEYKIEETDKVITFIRETN